MSTGFTVDRIVTSGTFALDGGTWNVDNNIWVIGDDSEVIIIDAAHDAQPIIEAVRGRRVAAVVCTHAHNDHITVAPELAHAVDAPVFLHPADDVLWNMIHPDSRYQAIEDGHRILLGGGTIEIIHVPGHSPGSVCLHVPESQHLFTGDTLFAGGPGATGRSFSDFPTIIASLRERLFTLPEATEVFTGHGDATTIGQEAPHLHEWIARGH
ncbi:Zn-dependent hydrolase [Mycobacterium sp. djl-10]|nr:Zn-dependent hydrolase [Mycobacterium sp. djl-10]